MSKKGATKKELTPEQHKELFTTASGFHADQAEYTKEQADELSKVAGNMFSESSEETKTPTDMYKTAAGKALENAAAEPKPQPVLTADEKVQILTLQRTALLAEQQKRSADTAFEKAMAELNQVYKAVNNHEGYALNEMSLEFVSTQQ